MEIREYTICNSNAVYLRDPDQGWVPGAAVGYQDGRYNDAYGIVISVETKDVSITESTTYSTFVKVLWSKAPNPLDFTAMANPLRRRVNYSAIAKSLVSVEPMTLPPGVYHYIDEMTKKP